MDNNWRNERLNFYRTWLCDDLLRFWQKLLDYEHGGVFTCVSNNGQQLLSTDKYVWSQGRMLWVLSRMYEMGGKGLIPQMHESYRDWADKTADFLLASAVLEPEDGVCAFLLDREGAKKEQAPGGGHHTSFFVDCFVTMGLAEYGRVFGRTDYIHRAHNLYKRTCEMLSAGIMRTEPYSLPEGHDTHSRPMILCNTANVLAYAMDNVDDSICGRLRRDALTYTKQVLDLFYCPQSGLVREIILSEGGCGAGNDSMLLRHVAPGHAVECMWMLKDTPGLPPDALDVINQIILSSLKVGWDAEMGGIYRYCDIGGGRPKGDTMDGPFAKLIDMTWDSKLWWVHSEALFSSLCAYCETGKDEFLKWYLKIEEYAFKSFPNPNREIGEWIQILDRSGRPMNQTIALPVKDPYHLMRNAILIIELLAEGRFEQATKGSIQQRRGHSDN